MGSRGPLEASERVYDPAPVKGRALGRRVRGAWPAATRRWWEAVSSLPHTVDWLASDWSHARATAEVHARAFEKGTATLWAELRVREERAGATEAGRRRLGIRYEQAPGKPKARSRRRSELRLVKDKRALSS